MNEKQVEKLLQQKEKEVRKEVQDQMSREIDYLKERCDFILQNEQVRATFMLREAHRERQEKISALQTQLQCKNLAGLMYVMCSERNKSRLEILRLKEEYTNYINALQDILSDAQKLILNLSRGYKTAARVDNEWRNKMKSVLAEFQCFVNDFTGASPEGNQYFFDLPLLLKTITPTRDNPEEDPCECEEEERAEEPLPEKKNWWERMGDDGRPFLVFGDMAEFEPPQRREVLTRVRAAKTAPKKWKEYVFNEMFISSECDNADTIKDEYPYRIPEDRWECPGRPADLSSRMSIATSRRGTRMSEDIRGNMGSILKIISTSVQPAAANADKTALLGARDSMEIASTTKLRTSEAKPKSVDHGKVILKIGSRRTSFFSEEAELKHEAKLEATKLANEEAEEEDEVSISKLSVKKVDSKEVIVHHKVDVDHKINYEKVCPIQKCQRMKADSFIRSLPPYMRANPFTHFEQNYEEYETCTAEQLEILKKRLEDKKIKVEKDESPLVEWTPSVGGVAVQTSDLSVSLPPCTCRDPFNTPASSTGIVFDLTDLMPVKHILDTVNQECLYDSTIDFNRFRVLGQDDSASTIKEKPSSVKSMPPIQDRNRIQEITKILKQHPSLLDIFQANAQCS